MPSNPTPTHTCTQQSQTFSLNIRISTMQAAHRNLTSPRYVWISHGWYSNQWWTQAVANDAINCSDTQLEAFLAKSRTLAVNHLPAPTDSNAETVAGIVSCDTTLCMQKWNRLALFQYKSASELHKWRRRLSVTNYSSTVCVWQFCVKDAKDCRRVRKTDLFLPWQIESCLKAKTFFMYYLW